jgi:hypothetical protein
MDFEAFCGVTENTLAAVSTNDFLSLSLPGFRLNVFPIFLVTGFANRGRFDAIVCHESEP